MRSQNLIPIQNPTQLGSSQAGQLVGLGFRCSFACLTSSSKNSDQTGCRVLSDAIAAYGLPASLNGEFAAWALAVEASREREIVVLPALTPGFCGDECLAIALVAACQHDRCPALAACAAALLGTHDIGRTLAATQVVAKSLTAARASLQIGPPPGYRPDTGWRH